MKKKKWTDSLLPLMSLIGGLWAGILPAQNCVNLGLESKGDMELIVDPSDLINHTLILLRNETDLNDCDPVQNPAGCFPLHITVTRLRGDTGTPVDSIPVVITHDYWGISGINGPEFVTGTDGRLGIFYRAAPPSLGIRTAWRAAQPSDWHAFVEEYDGSLFQKNPGGGPILANTAGLYPGAIFPPPDGISAFSGSPLSGLDGNSYGPLNGPLFNIRQIGSSQELIVKGTSPHPSRLGEIWAMACDTLQGTCGLYRVNLSQPIPPIPILEEVTYDDMGLSPVHFSNLPYRETLRGVLHPSNGNVYWFARDHGGNAIHVWEETSPGRLTRLSDQTGTLSPFSIPGPVEHFHIAKGAIEFLMYYQVREGGNKGSYAIKVAANGSLHVPQVLTDRLSPGASGVEVIYLPGGNHPWAYYVGKRTDVGGVPKRMLYRCWFNP